MKKYIITFLLFVSFGILQSVTLKNFYYRDYGYVNRLVFVFSSKPQYRVLNAEKQIQIELTNTVKSKTIPEKKSFLSNNIILKDIRFLTNQKNILILINTYDKYYLKKTFLLEGGYKIVLDVFKSKEATTAEMHKSYALFYSTVGYPERARWHTKQAKLLEKQEIESEKTQKISIKSEKTIKNVEEKINNDTQKIKKEITPLPQVTTSNENHTAKDIPQKIIIPFDILMFLATIAIIIILIVIFIVYKTKKRKDDDDEKNGFGDDDFNANLVIILFEKGWRIPEIAREVNLSEKAVRKIKKENKDIIKK